MLLLGLARRLVRPSAWRAVILFETITAKNRFPLAWLERHFAILAAIRAHGLEHSFLIKTLLSEIPSLWPVFARPSNAFETITAVYRPVARWTKRHFAILAAVGTYRVMHLVPARIPVVESVSPVKFTHNFFSYLIILIPLARPALYNLLIVS